METFTFYHNYLHIGRFVLVRTYKIVTNSVRFFYHHIYYLVTLGRLPTYYNNFLY